MFGRKDKKEMLNSRKRAKKEAEMVRLIHYIDGKIRGYRSASGL